MKKIQPGQSMSPVQDVWFRFKKNKIALVSLFFIIFIVLVAIFSGVLVDYEDVIKTDANNILAGPSREHIFGTDDLGRDLFARVVYGSRYSIMFGILGTLFSLMGGILFGASAAFFGGKVDTVIMFVMDAIICIPGMLLNLSLMAILGRGLVNVMIAVVISSIPGYARMVRSIVLGIANQEYMDAAKAIGVSNFRAITVHMIPNAIGLIIVDAAMNVAGLIMTAAALSFVGMGVEPPMPEWGCMLNGSLSYLRTAPHVIVFPGLAIVLTALSFNLLGDGLADALDPRMRE